jgi:hypothetical protein
MKIDEYFKQSRGKDRMIIIAGAVCFICIVAFTLLHLGFQDTTIHRTPIKKFLSTTMLWVVNLSLAVLGGILLDLKHFSIAAVSGLISGIILQGTLLLYLGWRNEIMAVEIIIPLIFTFLIGVKLHQLLVKLIVN